ncbi:MAG: SurA N-terminal domain-containing protein, partial [Pseudomonadota bacterium]
MIESLRNFVTSWVAKTLLALLVLSFLFFGVGDQLFFGAGPGDVAEVGEESITATEYRREFQAILNRSGVDAERGFVSGWHLITLNTLARQKALAQETRRLGFEASDAAVAETIRGGFQNIRGEFDETLYRRALAESGLRPKDYQDYVRQEMSSNLLAQAVAAGVAAPRTAAEAIWRRRNEKRDIEYVVLTGAQVPEETAPDDAALRAYYEERIDRFQTPESRRFRFLWLRPEDIADPASVSDEEVARAYEARRAEFQPPAQRFVDQLFIDDQAEAEAAAARIADGQPFARILEDRGLSLSEVSLGLQTEEQMGRFFPELAEADLQ